MSIFEQVQRRVANKIEDAYYVQGRIMFGLADHIRKCTDVKVLYDIEILIDKTNSLKREVEKMKLPFWKRWLTG